MPRTVENEAELLLKKVEHQALGSTLFAAIAGEAVDRQRLVVRLISHICSPSSKIGPRSAIPITTVSTQMQVHRHNRGEPDEQPGPQPSRRHHWVDARPARLAELARTTRRPASPQRSRICLLHRRRPNRKYRARPRPLSATEHPGN